MHREMHGGGLPWGWTRPATTSPWGLALSLQRSTSSVCLCCFSVYIWTVTDVLKIKDGLYIHF